MAIDLDQEIFSDYLLPVQYSALVRSGYAAAPEAEKNLLLGVLADAIRSFLLDRNATTRPRRLRFLETKRWFEESFECGAQGLFAYENLCEALGIDPNLLRARLGLSKNSHRPGAEIPMSRTSRRVR
jgi:hypothetical protein